MARLPEDVSAYAGRWVALVSGRVAGVGYTANEALRLARRNRPKARISLRYVEPAGGEALQLSSMLERIEPVLLQQEMPVYLVGGAVRDALLGELNYDLDFVVPEGAVGLAFRVADALGVPAYVLDRERDIGRVVLPDEGTMLDFARIRGADLVADLRDRDFTLNAMALPAGARSSASLIDPCGGQADLAARHLRLTHPAAIADDPVRALRAIRMALRFACQFIEETRQAVRAGADHLGQISPERLRDELVKLLQTGQPDQAVTEMADLGLLPVLLPEVAALAGVAQSPPHHEAVLPHTAQLLRWLVRLEAWLVDGRPVDDPAGAQAQALLAPYAGALAAHLDRPVDGGLTGRVLLRLGGLFHDVGKAQTQLIDPAGRIRFLGHEAVGAQLTGPRLKALHFSNEACDYVKKIVAGHMRPLLLANERVNLSRRATFRYFRRTGPAGLDICLVSLADHLATYGGVGDPDAWTRLLDVVAALLHAYFRQHETVVAPPPLLDGRDLVAQLSLKPGPEVGRLLRLLQEAQAAGEISTAEEALALARRNSSR
ncbi:MAG: HD domain-containing protein [Ardenticatenaceae bacterium]|nr:HD domain-containing protein [Ardenticatenaceae bacterium]